MRATRLTTVPDGVIALTATARGMVANSMMSAARIAYDELMQEVSRAGLRELVASYLSFVPDDPKGPDDPSSRFVSGLVFGYSLATSSGRVRKPPSCSLTGSLAWFPIARGRYAVFTHVGPYTAFHPTWEAIYRDWLPISGEQLRDEPPIELNLNRVDTTPPEALLTEIWLPIV